MTIILLNFLFCLMGFLITIFSIPRKLAAETGILKPVVFQLILFISGMLLNSVAFLIVSINP